MCFYIFSVNGCAASLIIFSRAINLALCGSEDHRSTYSFNFFNTFDVVDILETTLLINNFECQGRTLLGK